MTDRHGDKSAQAFRTISEVADELGLATHVLRFWESKFPQIKPTKRAGGRRYYRPDDVALLRRLQTLLHDEGYTIKGVQKLLREDGARKFIEEGYGHTDDLSAASDPEIPSPQNISDAILEPTPVVTPDEQPPSPQGSLFDAPAAPAQRSLDPSSTSAPPRLDPERAQQSHAGGPEPIPTIPIPQAIVPPGLSARQRETLKGVLHELGEIQSLLQHTAP